MCLAKLSEKKRKFGVGYKILADRDNVPTTIQQGHVELPINTWITDKTEGEFHAVWGGDFSYPAGFHVFLSLREAMQVSQHEPGHIYKVRFRKATATGVVEWRWSGNWNRHYPTQVVVAREVMNLGKV